MRRLVGLPLIAMLVVSAAYGQGTEDAAMKRKLALAQLYVDLTGKERRVADTFAKQLRLTFNGCTDDACRAALDKAIDAAVNEGAPEHEKATVKLIASRLTENELHAAISFAQSPEGQAIAAAQNEMSDDLAKIARTFSTTGFESVRRSFCATQQAACSRAFARLTVNPPGRP